MAVIVERSASCLPACGLLGACGILFDPEDRGNTLLRNRGTLLSGYLAPMNVRRLDENARQWES
jgi:hypothetical protein